VTRRRRVVEACQTAGRLFRASSSRTTGGARYRPLSQLTEGVGDSSGLWLSGVVAVLGWCIVTARIVQGLRGLSPKQRMSLTGTKTRGQCWPPLNGQHAILRGQTLRVYQPVRTVAAVINSGMPNAYKSWSADI
jgi:hypothetical protein